MAGAAKMTKMAMPVVEYVAPTEIRINAEKFKSFADCPIKRKISFSGTGVVKEIFARDKSHIVTIEISSLKKGGYVDE